MALTCLLLLVAGQQPDGKLHIWVLDVGQGDSILLRTPQGYTALIDGGPAPTAMLDALGKRLPFWQRNLDLVVLTHPNADHLAGLTALVGRYNIGQLLETEFTPTTSLEAAWSNMVDQTVIPTRYAYRGEKISFDGEPGLSLYVLSPGTPDAAQEGSGGDINNTSVVLKLTYGNCGALLEGDAQQEAEASMLAQQSSLLPSPILKVSHHGSSTSSTLPFLAAVRPKAAIISVGAGNPYGHPAAQTLQSLQAEGAAIYRTDLNGTVEVICDKEQTWVRSEK